MTIHDEFVEMLRILAEAPQPPVKKSPEPDRSQNASGVSPDCTNGERKGAAS